MTSILVGVDGSADGAEALRWTAREAQLRSMPVTALLAWGYVEQYRGIDRFDPHADEASAWKALDGYIDAALGKDQDVVTRRIAADGFAATALLEEATGHALLVVGARGRGGFAGLRLGSVSDQCLHHAPCPVAVVRAGVAAGTTRQAEGLGERVVVGFDGSDEARRALCWGIEEARLRNAHLTVVHALPTPMVGAAPFAPSTFDIDQLVTAGEADIRRALDREALAELEGRVEVVARCGSASGAIVDASEEASVVVVGSRGKSGFHRLLLGSVATQVAHHAACPVVVHRRIDRAPGSDR